MSVMLPHLSLVFRGLTLLLACGVGSVACAEDVVVTLTSPIEVSTRIFTLGEIAQIQGQGADSAAIKALRQLPVGQLGLAGRDLSLTRTEIMRYVRRHLPSGIEQVQWRGPDAIWVRTSTVRMEPQALVAHAQAQLRAHLEPLYPDLDLRTTSRLDIFRVPAGEITLSSHVFGGAPLQRRMRVDVELRSGHDFVRTVPIWFEVRAYAPGWVLTRDVAAGQVLRTGDIERRLIDVASVAGTVIPVSANVIGQRVRRATRAGGALSASLLDNVPLVNRRDNVTFEVRTGDVVIESRGTALAEGNSGDWVPVLVSGADLLRGRVVGPKRLELNLEEKR